MVTDPKAAPRRILLVRLSHLGDVVHALPVYHALRRSYPEAELAWAIQAEFRGLIEALPGLARTFTFERRGGLAAWWRLRRELNAWRPHWAVDAQANLKSAMVALSSGADRRSAPARQDWQERWASHAATDLAPPATARHAVERNLALARHVSARALDDGADFDLGFTPDELDRGRAQLAARAPSGTRALTLLLLPTEGDARSWPAAAWPELAARRARAGAHVLVVSGPAEEAAGRTLSAELPAGPVGDGVVEHWVGQRGLRELAAVFHAAAERDATCVACDTGPMHLAAACGLRVLLLAGPQDPARTGPWPTAVAPDSRTNGAHVALSADPAPECAPCLRRRCNHPRGPVCLSELAPEAVALALARG